MTPIVLDNSVVVSWCLADEHEALAEHAIRRAASGGAVAPGIWWYELRNALVMGERRGRLSAAQAARALSAVARLGIPLDWDHDDRKILDLTRRYRLSVYDAAYLEVAMRRGLPFATLDRRLREAAIASGVELLNEKDS